MQRLQLIVMEIKRNGNLKFIISLAVFYFAVSIFGNFFSYGLDYVAEGAGIHPFLLLVELAKYAIIILLVIFAINFMFRSQWIVQQQIIIRLFVIFAVSAVLIFIVNTFTVFEVKL